MNRLDNFRRQLQLVMLGSLLIEVAVFLGSLRLAEHLWPTEEWLVYSLAASASIVVAWLLAVGLSDFAARPLSLIWQAVIHVSPEHGATEAGAPRLEANKIAPELVTSLVLQIYQLASSSPSVTPNKKIDRASQLANNLISSFPLPVFAVSKNQQIIFANPAAAQYLNKPAKEVLKENFYSLLDLSFSDENTLDGWLQDCRANKATDDHSWQRVRLKLTEGEQTTTKQFDMAARYSKEDPDGFETIICLFDQTQHYGNEDQSLDFLAVAVHELRTPLTSLRGYIEVFEDELAGKLDPELTAFMHKMHVATQQLTAFISNVLDVARIQEGQLSLQLTEENWGLLIKEAVNNLALSARINDKVINYKVDGQVPLVGVDKVSMTEVINNLVDNAIKYSGDSQIITIESRVGQDGMVETIVRDDGVGIPEAVMPTLFKKFQRNHRNQARIGGSGLGLYLCSALVKAHGGNIWVKSKEGQGTTIGFTVQPYSQLAGKLKNSDNTDIVRNAHGWIKNHSLYRR